MHGSAISRGSAGDAARMMLARQCSCRIQAVAVHSATQPASPSHATIPAIERPRRPAPSSVHRARAPLPAPPHMAAPPRSTVTSTLAATPFALGPPAPGDCQEVTLAVVGDVHEQWDADSEAALASLGADLAVFVGDFGNEDVALIRRIAGVSHPKVVVLGNHDAWLSLTPRGRQRAVRAALMSSSLRALSNAGGGSSGVADQLQALGADHVGFSSRHFPALGLSVVGGRPFSKGGRRWDDVADFYREHYRVRSFQEAAHRIADEALSQPPGAGLVVVGHQGPTGLGEDRHSPCGVDWQESEGDHGDPDLQSAIDTMTLSGRPPSLVLFGHMHHTLKGGGRRDMAAVDAATGTVYLNAAVVPRVRRFPAAPQPELESHGAGASGEERKTQIRGHHFLMVHLRGRAVVGAKHVWVAAPAAAAEVDADGDGSSTGPLVLEEEAVLKTTAAGDGSGRVVCSYLTAHSGEWQQVVTPGQVQVQA